MTKKKDTPEPVDIEELKQQEQAKTTEDKEEAPLEEDKIGQLEEAISKEKDKALRAMAELENYKQRSEREKDEFRKYSQEKLLKEFLVVLDSFDYALSHADSDAEKIVEGMKMIQKQLNDVLGKHGFKRVESLNQPFDPNFHQAVGQEESDKNEADIVIKEMQPGYVLGDRVIRPAMVIVSK